MQIVRPRRDDVCIAMTRDVEERRDGSLAAASDPMVYLIDNLTRARCRTVGELNPAGAVKELERGKNTRPISVVVLPRALPASDIKRGCSFWWDDASLLGLAH